MVESRYLEAAVACAVIELLWIFVGRAILPDCSWLLLGIDVTLTAMFILFGVCYLVVAKMTSTRNKYAQRLKPYYFKLMKDVGHNSVFVTVWSGGLDQKLQFRYDLAEEKERIPGIGAWKIIANNQDEYAETVIKSFDGSFTLSYLDNDVLVRFNSFDGLIHDFHCFGDDAYAQAMKELALRQLDAQR